MCVCVCVLWIVFLQRCDFYTYLSILVSNTTKTKFVFYFTQSGCNRFLSECVCVCVYAVSVFVVHICLCLCVRFFLAYLFSPFRMSRFSIFIVFYGKKFIIHKKFDTCVQFLVQLPDHIIIRHLKVQNCIRNNK